MTKPSFFLPCVPTELEEDAYAFMATRNERTVPCMGKRVYSITFKQAEGLWTASVGERLKFYRTERSASEPDQRDPALVLAIFPDDPYCVVTDADPGSSFAGSFLVCRPKQVEHFFWPKRG